MTRLSPRDPTGCSCWLCERLCVALKPPRHRSEPVAYCEANRNRTRCAPLPETQVAEQIRYRGKRLQAHRGQPIQTGGAPLVESGRKRPACRRMLHRKHALAKLLQLEGLPCGSHLTKSYKTFQNAANRTPNRRINAEPAHTLEKTPQSSITRSQTRSNRIPNGQNAGTK